MAERFKAPVLKTGDGQPSVSSNLTASAIVASGRHVFRFLMVIPSALVRTVVALMASLSGTGAGATDLSGLWDFSQPAASEARFRAALVGASPDNAVILTTQIARTHGLRGDFDQARALLQALDASLATAGTEARAWHALETGRTYASATHPRQTQTPVSRAEARRWFERAALLAGEARADAVAVDAFHMLAFVEPAPADRLNWTLRALTIAEASEQPPARRWRASLHNNAGMALHDLGRLDDALTHFQRQVALRQEAGNVAAGRVARWMVAWTLRGLGRADDALAMQLELERELDQASETDVHVYEELATLYRERGDPARADHYAGLRAKHQAR